MITNLLGVVVRQTRKNPFYFALNLIGLTLGITSCLVITLFVKHELSFDQFHAKKDRTYRVNYDITMGGRQTISPSVPAFVAPHLKSRFPEIEHVSRYRRSYSDRTVRYEGKVFDEKGFVWADSTYFDIFDFTAVRGELKDALAKPTNLVITETVAKKYFNDEDPIGKTITVNDNQNYDVVAVIKDIPANSTFTFNFMASVYGMNDLDESVVWSNPNWATWVVLHAGTDVNALAAKIDEWVNPPGAKHGTGNSLHLPLEPLKDVHFNTTVFNYGGELAVTDRNMLSIFISIGVLILVMACINYVNLATSRSVMRAKEVGLRKTVGATFRNLVTRFLAESFFLVLPALLVSLMLVAAVLPLVNDFTGKQIPLDFTDPFFVSITVLGWIIISVLSGFYPAVVLARFKPITVLKGKFFEGNSGWGFRKSLVVLQFMISGVMITATIILIAQLNFVQSKQLGLDKDHVFFIRGNSQLQKNFSGFATELRNIAGVQEASVTWRSPFSTVVGNGLAIGANPGDDAQWLTAGAIYADEHYLATLGITLKSGRNFNPVKSSGEKIENEFIVNETFLDDFGIDPATAVGSKVTLGVVANNGAGTIVGVVNDFHTASLTEKVAPIILFNDPSYAGGILVRAAGAQVPDVLRSVEDKWKSTVSNRPFNYSFLDEQYNSLYQAQMRSGTLITIFAIISIGIACFGLLGLSSFTAIQRAREIGVRKVLGATTGNIVLLLSRDYLTLLVISCLLAVPASYMVMQRWLQQFAYHIDLHPMYFVGGIISVLFIAWATVGYHSVKASVANPVDSLKYE